jgi:hypothetical protein
LILPWCCAKVDCRWQPMVTIEQFFRLWRAIAELSDDPALGLKLPGLVPVEQHHPAGIAAYHARTFRDALQRFARYKILCCHEELRFTETKGECSLEFNWLLSREAPPFLLLRIGKESRRGSGGLRSKRERRGNSTVSGAKEESQGRGQRSRSAPRG